MKKIIIVLICFIIGFVVLHIYNTNETAYQTMVCQIKEENNSITVNDIETLEHKDGNIIKIVSEFYMQSNNQESIEVIKEMYFEEDESIYYDYEGLNYSLIELDDGIKVEIVLDVSKASLDILVEAGLIAKTTIQDGEINLLLYQELLIASNFSCDNNK